MARGHPRGTLTRVHASSGLRIPGTACVPKKRENLSTNGRARDTMYESGARGAQRGTAGVSVRILPWVAACVLAASCWVPAGADQRADAVLIVNSQSGAYEDVERYIRPYLVHFGVPFTVLDVSSSPVGPEIGDYSLILIGHRELDPDHLYLDSEEQSHVAAAVANGSGLVNFDNDLSPDGSTPRYPFVQDIFGFGYVPRRSDQNVVFTEEAPAHYVTELHDPTQVIGTGFMTLAGVTLPPDVTPLAVVEFLREPLVAVTVHGLGRAVQWGSYEWMANAVKGPVRELDDLVWRGFVWAARKPFVLQGFPNFVTMRVDDSRGGFWWVEAANRFGLKPWLGLFYRDILDVEAQKLSGLVHSGLATATVHAKSESGGVNGTFFYFDHYAGAGFSDAMVDANFDEAISWHDAHDVPIGQFVAAHWYEMGSNVFGRLRDWGVEFVATHMEPGLPYVASPWLQLGPYRLFETGRADHFEGIVTVQ